MAAGMLLQIMPDGSGTPEDFEHLTTLAVTIKKRELFGLPAEELLYRLYHEETVNLYPATRLYIFLVAALQSVLVLHYCSSPMKKLMKY